MASTIMSTYARLPIGFTHGEGVFLFDDAGNRYLDALSGIAVNCLGHAHPALTSALCEQAGKLIHTSNLYQIAEQEDLAGRLTKLARMDKVFFCNSGAEANEAAIKLARLYGHQQGHAVPRILVAEGSFHGRTLATLTATGNPRIQAGFEPLVDGFVRVPYNDIDAITETAAKHGDIVAVLIETIQGEGGVNIPDADYLPALADICKTQKWLLMVDEVQTGIGRTGKWFGYQHYNIQPDVISLAKGLGGGVPIGACVAHGAAADILIPGSHGSTFGGNQLACSAAISVLDTITDEKLCENARNMGRFLVETLQEQIGGLEIVKQIRGQGLMVGIELLTPCTELVQKAIDSEKLLLNVTAGNVIRLLPPLILNQHQAADIAAKVSTLVKSL
jgi:acetylornithine aminotransferase